jgi:uncharacterized protein (DUF2147 family)
VDAVGIELSGISKRLVSAIAVIAAGIPAAALAAEKLDGFWMDSDGEVVLEIKPCGDARCGKVAWLKQPLGPDGLALLDYRNPNPTFTKRPVCGLEVVSDFKKQQDGTWGGGTVYVSDQGTSYSGYAEVLSPTQIKVTGYIALPIFGISEVWTRVSKPVEPCLEPGTRPQQNWTATQPIPVLPDGPKRSATNGSAH